MSYSRDSRRRSWLRPWLGRALVCAVLLLLGRAHAQQALVRPDNSRPIELHADNVTTWLDNGQRVFLLQGKVNIAQGDTQLQMPQGVVWVDEQRRDNSLTYQLDVFGDGALQVQQGGGASTPTGPVRLTTVGQVNIKAFGGPVQQQTADQDPLFLRARASRPAAAPVQQAAVVAATDASSAVRPVAAQEADLVPPPPPPTDSVSGAAPQALPTQLPRTAPTPGAADAVTIPPRAGAGLPRAQLPPPRKEDEDDEPAMLSSPRPFPQAPAPVEGEPRQLTIRPRFGQAFSYESYPSPSGETAIVFTNGVILRVSNPRKTETPESAKKKEEKDEKNKTNDKKDHSHSSGPPNLILDIEADRLVVWTKENSKQLIDNMTSAQGETSRTLEFFLSGNVEMRIKNSSYEQTLRAEQVYYDVGRSVAVALKGDLEMQTQVMPYPVHIKADELLRINEKLFQANRAVVYSTLLPSDPGLTVQVQELQIEEVTKRKRGFLGWPLTDPATGQPRTEQLHYFTCWHVIDWLEGIPFFYFPYLRGNVEDPLGPLENFNFNYNKIFGWQIFTTWDIYQLLGLERISGTRWRLYADYMQARGPALGEQFDYSTIGFLGTDAKVDSVFKAYGVHDTGVPVAFVPGVTTKDVLGGTLGYQIPLNPTTFVNYQHPEWRGRILGQQNVQELPYGFSVQGQVWAATDRNFMPQFYMNEYMTGPNNDSYLYVKQQQNQWAWTALADGYISQPWMTRVNWLPKADGWLLSQDLFDLFTYNAHVSAGFAQFRTADVPPPVVSTDRPTNTARLDLWQDLSLPVTLGAFKVVPYVQADLTYYSQALQGNNGNAFDAGLAYATPTSIGYYGQPVPGNSASRAYEGAGLRVALPISRLFPDIRSDLFNVDGIYHKVVLTGNYYYGHSNISMFNLPQLDRLDDDASDRTLRDIYPYQQSLNPANAAFLTTSPLFNPQVYALQRLLWNRTDTLDNVDVLQLGLRQRWQTKRGFPDNQHIVDWMTLDLRGSLFPNPQQANLSNTVGILEYDWVWNLGDRTALTSSGWTEPVDGGPRYFSFNGLINRPDGTSLTLGYRQLDPLLSRAVLASINFPFSAKYAVVASTSWDFGAKNQTYSFMLTRMGSDVMVMAGLSFNSILSNFGITFEVFPSLLRNQMRNFGTGTAGGNSTNNVNQSSMQQTTTPGSTGSGR